MDQPKRYDAWLILFFYYAESYEYLNYDQLQVDMSMELARSKAAEAAEKVAAATDAVLDMVKVDIPAAIAQLPESDTKTSISETAEKYAISFGVAVGFSIILFHIIDTRRIQRVRGIANAADILAIFTGFIIESNEIWGKRFLALLRAYGDRALKLREEYEKASTSDAMEAVHAKMVELDKRFPSSLPRSLPMYPDVVLEQTTLPTVKEWLSGPKLPSEPTKPPTPSPSGSTETTKPPTPSPSTEPTKPPTPSPSTELTKPTKPTESVESDQETDTESSEAEVSCYII